MNVAYFCAMFDYSYWAHRRVWACVTQLTDEQFTRNLGYSWGSINGQVAHTMNAEWVWLSRMQGTASPAMLKFEDFPTRESVRAQWDEIESKVRAFLGELTDARLDQTIFYLRADQPYSQKVWEILAHVINHGTDHRAQTLAMLHQLGAPTVEQDIIIYLREQQGQA